MFAVGRGDATFLAASPELLVRREGQRASTVALAGSIGRSADPAVDDHLGERLLRATRTARRTRSSRGGSRARCGRTAVWVTAAPEPALVRVANIQHLARPIRAQLASPVPAIELAGALHPTPAVGGEPREAAVRADPGARRARPRLVCRDRRLDRRGRRRGILCRAAVRLAARRDSRGCYAGCGIVADSDPAAELAETETKLGALLPLLAG